MIRTIFLLATLAASPALAAVCGADQPTDIPEIEAAKAAFLSGEYREFSTLMGDYFQDLDKNYDALFGPLETVAPNAFARCETLLQRREEPGFYQELTMYFSDDFEGPVTVLLIAARIDGQVTFLEFTYNTSISDVIENLR